MSFDLALFLRTQVFWWCSSRPKQAITYNWLFILVLSVLTFIISCAAASHSHDKDGHDAIAFAGVWTALVLLVLGVGGTMTLRKHHNHLAVGVFMGIIFVMCSQMLIVFSIFAEHADQHSSSAAKDSENAMAVFTFFLFIAFSSFAGMLLAFQDEVIKVDDGGADGSGGMDSLPGQSAYTIDDDDDQQ